MFIKNYEIFSGLAAALVILAGVFIFQTPLWINLIISLSLFTGLFLVGSFWMEIRIEQEAKRMTHESMADRIERGRAKLADIRKSAGKIKQIKSRDQITRICDLGERIFDNFDGNPSAISGASRFLLYIDRILPYFEKYAEISSTKSGMEMVGRDAEILEIMNSLEQGFEQGFKNYLERDVVELKTVGRVLRKMMQVAEIGK